MSLLARALAQVLAETPSLQAAAKVGKAITINAVVTRADGRVEDLGQVAGNFGTFESIIRAVFGHVGRVKPWQVPKIVIRFVYKGQEIEKANY